MLSNFISIVNPAYILLIISTGALLTQHEELKLRELDEECARALKDFKASIPPKMEVSLTTLFLFLFYILPSLYIVRFDQCHISFHYNQN